MRKFLLGLCLITAVISATIWVFSPGSNFGLLKPGQFTDLAFSSSSNTSETVNTYAAEVLRLDFSKEASKPLEERRERGVKQIGWIPDWDFANGYSSLMQAADKFASVSPVWYYLRPDGSVNASRAGLAELKALRSSKGIKIIPSIASFNSDEFGKILATNASVKAHADFLKREVETYDLDGLDLDYESLYFADQENYLQLIKNLYSYLDQRGKKLTIAVMPNWTYQNIHRGSVQTRQTQDWEIMGQYSHEVRIMTYNLTGAQNKYPGPIGPLDWLEANMRYAVTRIDPAKIYLGVHLYAYAGWSKQPKVLNRYLSVYTNPQASGITASALEYEDILSRRQFASSDIYDKQTGESILQYSSGGANNVAYYIDRQGMQARRDLVKRYDVGGIAYWRLGDEDVAGY
jgi:spore germination protein